MSAVVTQADRDALTIAGYRVIDARNEHVVSGHMVKLPDDASRMLIAATEDEAWALAAAHRTAASQASDAGEDIQIAIAKAIHGPDFDPFQNPEAFDACESIAAAILATLTAPPTSDAGVDAVTDRLAEQVEEAMQDDAGFWRSCTGCYETCDGYPTGAYRYSNALKCDLGAGCRECGGLGAIWDDTDYADMAEFMIAADRDHENVKRILIENGAHPYLADEIAVEITALNIPAALKGAEGRP